MVDVQAGHSTCPTTEGLEQNLFYNSPVWGQPVPRVRTVVRGERASRSIVNRTTALWSIWMVSSLILAGSGFGLFMKTWGREFASRQALTEHLI